MTSARFSSVVLAFCVLEACGGGGDDAPRDGALDDASDAASDAAHEGGIDASLDASPGDGATDASTDVKPVIFAIAGEGVPIASSVEAAIAISGSGLASCDFHFTIGGRKTQLVATFRADQMAVVTVPTSATDGLRGYATLTAEACPLDSVPYPVSVLTRPTPAWAGAVIAELAPLLGGTGTSVTVSGTLTGSTRVALPAGDTALAASAFTVPAALVTGPLRFPTVGQTDVFVSFPFHRDANLATSATATASTTHPLSSPAHLIDGTMANGWYSTIDNCTGPTCGNQNVWVELSWGAAQTIGTVAFRENTNAPSGSDVITVVIETYETAGSVGNAIFAQNFRLPHTLVNADIAFDPPLTNVRALRVRIIADDSITLGTDTTPTFGELMVFAP